MVLDNQKQKLLPEEEVWDHLLHLFGITGVASTLFLLHVKWMSQLKPLNISAQPPTPHYPVTHVHYVSELPTLNYFLASTSNFPPYLLPSL